jgi:hypothetical protein
LNLGTYFRRTPSSARKRLVEFFGKFKSSAASYIAFDKGGRQAIITEMVEEMECVARVCQSVSCRKAMAFLFMRRCMASGETSTGWHHWMAFAANGANVVFASRQAPKVTRARKRLPVIFDMRWTKPVRRAVASLSSAAKKSVTMVTALRVHAGIEGSFEWCWDESGNPAYRRRETSLALDHGSGDLLRFVPMTSGVPWGEGLGKDDLGRLGAHTLLSPRLNILYTGAH